MDYSTFIRTGYKPDRFDELKLYLNRAKRIGKPVYVLTMSKEDHFHEKITEKLKELPGVIYALPVNGTIDVIMAGTEKEAKELAKKLYIETSEHIGCVKYDGDNMINFYVTLKDAISIARKKNKPWHVYNPNEDSLDALIKKARLD